MNNFMFNDKQLKMNEFIKYILQLIISTSNATLEVPSATSLHLCLRPVTFTKKETLAQVISC